MNVIKRVKEMKRAIELLKRKGKTIGFVPTMGALHEGHGFLMDACRKENDISVLSIFVNPLQFGPKEDFKKYPRENQKDELFAKKRNVDIIFSPSAKEMYPSKILTHIQVDELTEHLCGKFRPGHFTGVTTVVGKLINIVQPNKIYFGQKDAQQAFVIKKMIIDLNFPTAIKILPTKRDKDGLALSSRNRYLSPIERQHAPRIYQALQQAKASIQHGERDFRQIKHTIQLNLERDSIFKVQYIECVDTETLKPLKTLKGKILLAIAAFLGSTRLIDNIIVPIK